MPDGKKFCLECEFPDNVIIRKYFRFRFAALFAGFLIQHGEHELNSSYRPYLLSCFLSNSDGDVIRVFFDREFYDDLEGGDGE